MAPAPRRRVAHRNTAARGPAAPCRTEPLEPRRLMSVNVTTYHYDNGRAGANAAETTLTPANVNSGTFGKLASLPVDGQVYAQPLVMTGVPVAGQGTHDVVLVATEHDSVYAFDARGNNPPQGYLWRTSLLQSGETPVPQRDYGTTDITVEIGITGTPVIDPSTRTLYVVGAFKELNGTYQQRLYALDLSTGATKLGGPALIAASVAGTGDGASGGRVGFDPFRENQRPALTLANGQVYVAWASHADVGPYHGWVMAYSAATLKQDYVYNANPNGSDAGIWMSGGGIAVDANGDLYFTTGNGTFDANTGGADYGMSLEKLGSTLALKDYFTPYNQAALSNADLDYGCSVVILLPNQGAAHPNETLSVGKWGTIYLNNRDAGQLGGFTANGPDKVLSRANITPNVNAGNVHNSLSYWNGHAYIAGDGLPLQSFAVGGGTIGATPTSRSANVFGRPNANGQGAGPTVSANGTANGIVWAVDNSGFNSRPAVLYAYDANNVGQLLYSSTQAAGGRDTAGNAVKYQDAVVANGLVYVAGAGSVTVYGLLPTATAQLHGNTYGTPGSFNNVPADTIAAATDGNLSTFFDAPMATGGNVGINLGTARVVTQVRFAPRNGFEYRMTGGLFQVSTSPTFANNITTVYTVATQPARGQLTTVNLSLGSAYQYWRYIGPTGGFCDIAEFQLFGPTTATPAQLTGTPFGTAGSYGNGGNTIAKATDGNPSTFFDGPAANGNTVGLDLGTPKQIDQVRFAPRAGYASRMVGGTFQASNAADFGSGVTTLYTVSASPADGVLTTVNLSSPVVTRYVRYLSPAGSYGNVAEVQIFG